MGKRNIQGGKKTKAMARYDSVDNTAFVQPDPPNLQIALVTQVLGNSQFLATFHDMTTTIAILPGRMKGKNKRNFLVQKFSLLLLQLRHDMSNPTKNTDILHIYPNQHFSRIFNLLPNFQNIIHDTPHNSDQHILFQQDYNDTLNDIDTLIEQFDF